MLIRTICDHCRVSLDVSRLKIGKSIVCSQCDREFVAQEVETLEEILDMAADEPDMQQPVVPREFASKASLSGPLQKHHLTLPPPPIEQWNNTEDEEDEDTLPGQRFKRFRPSKRKMKEFLDPESQGDDYSWLLVAGLVAFGVVLLMFMFGLIVIVFRR